MKYILLVLFLTAQTAWAYEPQWITVNSAKKMGSTHIISIDYNSFTNNSVRVADEDRLLMFTNVNTWTYTCNSKDTEGPNTVGSMIRTFICNPASRKYNVKIFHDMMDE